MKDILIRQIEAARGVLTRLEQQLNQTGPIRTKVVTRVSVAAARLLEVLHAAEECGLLDRDALDDA
jgi:hypothetical protein